MACPGCVCRLVVGADRIRDFSGCSDRACEALLRLMLYNDSYCSQVFIHKENQ